MMGNRAKQAVDGAVITRHDGVTEYSKDGGSLREALLLTVAAVGSCLIVFAAARNSITWYRLLHVYNRVWADSFFSLVLA